jgi:hypothetical protein
MWNLLDDGRAKSAEPNSIGRCRLLLAACQDQAKPAEIRKSGLPSLKKLWLAIHTCLFDAARGRMKALTETQAGAALVSIKSSYTACRASYDLDGGLLYAANRSIAAIETCLTDLEFALTMEAPDVQNHCRSGTFFVAWSDLGREKHLSLRFGPLAAYLRTAADNLRAAAPPHITTAAALVAVRQLAPDIQLSCSEFVHPQYMMESFVMLAKGHKGISFYTAMPVPGPMHLHLRTVEKVIDLNGLLAFVLTGSEDAAIAAALKCKAPAKYTTDSRGAQSKKFKVHRDQGRVF